jgi:allantoate deiminase
VNGSNFDQLATEILERCDALARCTDEAGRITRTFCSPAMHDAHRLVIEWMKAAGMAPRVDAAGNLIGTYLPPGCDSRRRVMIGSHLDTVADAGRYDGTLGVMMGIAAVESLRESGVALPWAMEVIGFSDEEGVRFGAPFIGSRALTGTLDAGMLALQDAGGVSMAETLELFGANPNAMAECEIEAGSVVAYLEPHIEQGPLLELVNEPIGVVTAIAGQTRMTLQWAGEGGHAGTVPMTARHDPLVSACVWVQYVDWTARKYKGLVATVGRLDVEPNVPNCIPRRVRASLDIRHADDHIREKFLREQLKMAEFMAHKQQVDLQIKQDHEHAAIAMDVELTGLWASVIAAAGHEPQRLVSGAGHDAGVMATVAPTAMLFLRSPGGVSHHPAEAVLHGDVAAGLAALVQFVEELANT